MEFIYIGYNVSIENNNGRELDFIVTTHNINDNYPKFVISTDKLNYSQNGIIHKNIIDWLLEEK